MILFVHLLFLSHFPIYSLKPFKPILSLKPPKPEKFPPQFFSLSLPVSISIFLMSYFYHCRISSLSVLVLL